MLLLSAADKNTLNLSQITRGSLEPFAKNTWLGALEGLQWRPQCPLWHHHRQDEASETAQVGFVKFTDRLQTHMVCMVTVIYVILALYSTVYMLLTWEQISYVLYHTDWDSARVPAAIIYLCFVWWLMVAALCVTHSACVCCVFVRVCVCDERDGVRPEACSGHGLRPPHTAPRMDLGLTQLPQLTLHSGGGGVQCRARYNEETTEKRRSEEGKLERGRINK